MSGLLLPVGASLSFASEFHVRGFMTIAVAAAFAKRTAKGDRRWKVVFRLGGRESKKHNGGTFTRERDAKTRAGYLHGEIVAGRVPELAFAKVAPTAPTFAEAAARWQASRLDVREATVIQHRSAVRRLLPLIGATRVDEITPAAVANAVAALHSAGSARETIRKSVTALAMTLDHAGVSPNPARDRVHVRLPREEPEEIAPPTADAIEAVARLLPSAYRLAVLVLDATGCRVGEMEGARISDLDESRQAFRVRAAVSKTRRARWVRLPDDLWSALLDRVGPREDRDPDARLFGEATANRLRTAIARACTAAGIPRFSPHDLRHRRISLMHQQGVSWAEIGERVGQRSRAVTADTYSHTIADYREIDRTALLN
jgi:integrase